MDLEDVRTTWENIGRDDPFWGVLSWQGTEDGRWDLDEFYGLGEKDIAAFFEEARVVGAEPRREAALDFGCGVGRLSRALATRFTTVHGVDISAPMVEQAQRLVGAEFANCTFQVSTSERLPYAAGSFDLVVSNLVLQHMPPRLAQRYVGEFLRVLARDGVAIVQVPSEQRQGASSRNPVVRFAMNALPSKWREEIMRRRGVPGPRDLPMHGIPRSKMLRGIERRGGQVVACIEDGAAGQNWRSFHYIVRRQPDAA